jgi:hypothetical protein
MEIEILNSDAAKLFTLHRVLYHLPCNFVKYLSHLNSFKETLYILTGTVLECTIQLFRMITGVFLNK